MYHKYSNSYTHSKYTKLTYNLGKLFESPQVERLRQDSESQKVIAV